MTDPVIDAHHHIWRAAPRLPKELFRTENTEAAEKSGDLEITSENPVSPVSRYRYALGGAEAVMNKDSSVSSVYPSSGY